MMLRKSNTHQFHFGLSTILYGERKRCLEPRGWIGEREVGLVWSLRGSSFLGRQGDFQGIRSTKLNGFREDFALREPARLSVLRARIRGS